MPDKMEDKIKDRQLLADTIGSLLLSDEEEGIKMWRASFDALRSSDSELPEIDVLACVYNAEKYVANAIESVLLQSYPKINFIIVSDGCTDATTSIIAEYASKFPTIKLIVNPENYGIIRSANIGLKACKSNFIARMDLDDLIHPLRLEKQMDVLLKNPRLGAISSYMKIFNERHEIKEVGYRDDYNMQKVTMLFYSPLSHAASLFRADVIQSIGYRDGYNYAEDYDLWFQIMSQYQTAVHSDYLYYYRTHSKQVTNHRNIDIIKGTWVKILHNIFTAIGLEFTESDIKFHIQYCSLQGPIKTLEEWLPYHQWLNKLVKANDQSRFFDQATLKEFLFMNYWMTGFNQFKSQMSLKQFIQVANCPLNPLNRFGKYKLIAKQLIGR